MKIKLIIILDFFALFSLSIIASMVVGCSPVLSGWEVYNNGGIRAFGDGDYLQADEYFLKAVVEAEKQEYQHPYLYSSLINLSYVYQAQERYSEADSLLRRALAVIRKESDDSEAECAFPVILLAGLSVELQQYERADSLFRNALDFLDRVAPNDPMVSTAKMSYGLLLLKVSDDESSDDDEDIMKFKGITLEGKYPRVNVFIPYDEPPKPVGGYGEIGLQIHNILYPDSALVDSVKGKVVVQAFVARSGVVAHAFLQEGDPDSDLGKAAVLGIEQTRFDPATQRGNPVGVWISIPVNY